MHDTTYYTPIVVRISEQEGDLQCSRPGGLGVWPRGQKQTRADEMPHPVAVVLRASLTRHPKPDTEGVPFGGAHG